MYQKTEKSTMFGNATPFGRATPFRYPNPSGGSFSSILGNLAMQLYPTGRAFNIFKNSIMDKFHFAFNISFVRFLEDALLTLDSCFPDNENFNADDCSLWEYRFGLITNSLLTVEDRRLAIFRRMARGRNIPARQHLTYLEYQLQLAGFNVFIHENGFIEGGILVHKRPDQITGLLPEQLQHALNVQHGIGAQHGSVSSDVIANSYLPEELHSVGDDYLSKTFFIGGSVLGSTATIPEIREQEFRELVLKLKPAHLVVFTFIDYV